MRKVKEWTRVGPRDFWKVIGISSSVHSTATRDEKPEIGPSTYAFARPVSTEVRENFPCNAARDIGVVHEK